MYASILMIRVSLCGPNMFAHLQGLQYLWQLADQLVHMLQIPASIEWSKHTFRRKCRSKTETLPVSNLNFSFLIYLLLVECTCKIMHVFKHAHHQVCG